MNWRCSRLLLKIYHYDYCCCCNCCCCCCCCCGCRSGATVASVGVVAAPRDEARQTRASIIEVLFRSSEQNYFGFGSERQTLIPSSRGSSRRRRSVGRSVADFCRTVREFPHLPLTNSLRCVPLSQIATMHITCESITRSLRDRPLLAC